MRMLEVLQSSLKFHADFPKPGINFVDLCPIFADAKLNEILVALLAREVPNSADIIAGVESRGFILGAAVANCLQMGFVPVRKPGKLPGDTHQASYTLEYGQDSLEVQHHSFRGKRVVIIDDVAATGGTLQATQQLIYQDGGELAASVVAINLKDIPKVKFDGELSSILEL